MLWVPAAHENVDDPAVLKKVLATQADLNPGQVQMLNWALLKVGKSFEKHYHEDMQEIFVMLSGQTRMIAGDESVLLVAGDTVIVAPSEIHQMHNLGDQDATFLVLGIATGQDGKTVRVS